MIPAPQVVHIRPEEKMPVPQAMQNFLGSPAGVHLTERQVVWVLHRLSQEDDLYACVSAQVDPDEVIEWRKDPAFAELIAAGLGDKKGTFRQVTSHLLPLAGRVIYDMLAHGDQKARNSALKHLVDVQGLKVTTHVNVDPDGLGRLMDKLRDPVPIPVVDMEPRE